MRNSGHSRHQRLREAPDGHAFNSYRWEECVQIPAKMARSTHRTPFGLPEATVAGRTSLLSCGKAGKPPTFKPVRESSAESGFKVYVGGGRQCTLTLQAPRPNLCGDEAGDIRPWPLRSNAGPAYKASTAESYSEIAQFLSDFRGGAAEWSAA